MHWPVRTQKRSLRVPPVAADLTDPTVDPMADTMVDLTDLTVALTDLSDPMADIAEDNCQ